MWGHRCCAPTPPPAHPQLPRPLRAPHGSAQKTPFYYCCGIFFPFSSPFPLFPLLPPSFFFFLHFSLFSPLSFLPLFFPSALGPTPRRSRTNPRRPRTDQRRKRFYFCSLFPSFPPFPPLRFSFHFFPFSFCFSFFSLLFPSLSPSFPPPSSFPLSIFPFISFFPPFFSLLLFPPAKPHLSAQRRAETLRSPAEPCTDPQRNRFSFLFSSFPPSLPSPPHPLLHSPFLLPFIFPFPFFPFFLPFCFAHQTLISRPSTGLSSTTASLRTPHRIPPPDFRTPPGLHPCFPRAGSPEIGHIAVPGGCRLLSGVGGGGEGRGDGSNRGTIPNGSSTSVLPSLSGAAWGQRWGGGGGGAV